VAAHSPEELIKQFNQAFNAHDSEAVLALYETDGCLVTGPGQVATGTAALREAINGFLASKPNLQMEALPAIQTGDIAMTGAKWNLTGTDPSGAPVNLSGVSAEIVRRQPDGSWLLVVDNPFAASA
jgi:uncharacterized protein (TIGR02246 family)